MTTLRERAVALDAFELAGAHDETAAKFLEYRRIGRGVGLVALVVLHIDPRRSSNPSAFSRPL